jgi:hypothetical protein
MNTLNEILVYFAKFPLKSGVQSLFQAAASERSAYAALKSQIDALTPHSLVPGITDFIMGLDEKTIKDQISAITGSYLFVDYGHISSDSDNYQRQNDRILIAITVATPLIKGSMDLVEQVLLSDENLNLLLQIRDIMKADSSCSPFVRQLSFPHEITPFFARELSDSTGWTMVFQKTGIQLV